MRRSVLGLVAVLLTACSGGSTAASQPTSPPGSVTETAPPGTPAEVIRILDGDSLIVRVDGSELEVRLIGINAPEGTECHGDVSRDTLQQIVSSGEITLVADPAEGAEEFDQYGRALRYLYVDGLNVNLALLANGDAIALQTGHSAEEEFNNIADAAYSAGLGMWSLDACGSGATPPQLEIVDYRYNPPGRDEDSMDEEWVVIANQGSTATDIGGWVLRDESTQNRFVFPSGFTIPPGSRATIRSGCGTDTGTNLYWCADDPVWSNGGDTMVLQTSNGTIVSRERYSGDF